MGKPLKISGYYLNNSQKNFDYTMDRFYELLEDQKKPQQKNEFTAIILSGLVTTSTTSSRFFDILETSLNGVTSYEYKIRFIEQDEKYNRVIDPFSEIVSTETERRSLINDHESAYFEENSSISSAPNPGSTVIVTKVDGIYKITKILTFSDGNMPPINSGASSSPSSAFKNPSNPFQFIQNFLGGILPPSTEAAKEIAKAYPLAENMSNKIVEVANNIGTNPYWLANLINFESAGTFDPSIKNELGYVGLIQFGKAAASDLGTTREALQAMTAIEQLDYVEKYFQLPHKRRNSNYSTPIDLYMAVFYPLGIGKPDYNFPSEVIRANNGIDTPREYARRANRNAKLPTGM